MKYFLCQWNSFVNLLPLAVASLHITLFLFIHWVETNHLPLSIMHVWMDAWMCARECMHACMYPYIHGCSILTKRNSCYHCIEFWELVAKFISSLYVNELGLQTRTGSRTTICIKANKKIPAIHICKNYHDIDKSWWQFQPSSREICL